MKYFFLLLLLLPIIASGEAEIIDVYRLEQKDYPKKHQAAGINDTLVVKFNNLNQATELGLCTQIKSENCNQQKINLYFNGKKIAEKDPKKGLLGTEPDTIEFDLEYGSDKDNELDKELKKNWASLLGSPPFFSSEFFKRPVSIMMGVDTKAPYRFDEKFNFQRFDTPKFWIFIVILITFSTIIFKGFKQKLREALSDTGPAPASGLKTWSLGRCQMAFWFVLVCISFLSIWVVTGSLDTITGSVLALIGIGSGTALGSAMIDVSDGRGDKQKETVIDSLKAEKKKIADEISEINSELTKKDISENQEKYLSELKQKLIENLNSTRQSILVKMTTPASQGFLNDILTDRKGEIGFYRIQMVAWTIILGGIYIFSVWSTLSMPTFSDTLLALQGLSSGTYLGFKFPDKKL